MADDVELSLVTDIVAQGDDLVEGLGGSPHRGGEGTVPIVK